MVEGQAKKIHKNKKSQDAAARSVRFFHGKDVDPHLVFAEYEEVVVFIDNVF